MTRFGLFVACGLGVLSMSGLAPSGWAAEPIDLHVRTARDLAALCATPPNSAGADAKINFCHGFAQGAVEDRLRMSADKKPFCFPTPAPKRSATIAEFVGWVRSMPANGDMPAIDGFFKFLGERFPCKS
jgi:hypothetical protein